MNESSSNGDQVRDKQVSALVIHFFEKILELSHIAWSKEDSQVFVFEQWKFCSLKQDFLKKMAFITN